jgi:ADP-ribosyl-[dinitrogen reductase] hydrolase
MTARTSSTHPLQVGFVSVPGTAGQVGLTFCPGKKQVDAVTGEWDRDLAMDLDVLVGHGVTALLTLVEDHELRALQVEALGDMAAAKGIAWHYLPIVDRETPTLEWELGWFGVGPQLREAVLAGSRVVVHCKGGLGRAGTVACRLLVELGLDPTEALQAVRKVRPGAVENERQERYVATTSRIGLAERLAGGILGVLVGDALGVPYEFRKSHQIPPLPQIEMQPPANFDRAWAGVPIGTWSDDGALTLCLLASLNAKGQLDLTDFGSKLVAWMMSGYMAVSGKVFDVGNATSAGIHGIIRGIPAADAGGKDESSNGNGALMRVLPIALWHTGSDEALVRDARASSLPTHGHLRSQLCCALYCLVARHLLLGDDQPWERSVTTLRALFDPKTPERVELENQILGFDQSMCAGTGYVVDSLYCARRLLEAPDYETAMKRAIAMGNDTDTTACIAGGLAGIRWGVRGIPPRWLNMLREKDVAMREIARLVDNRLAVNRD